MVKLTIQELQARLPDIIHNLQMGEEILVLENNLPVAKLVKSINAPKSALRPAPGHGKGMITVIQDDREHLQDFADYMP
ncbi:type II toxin-antitoxin system Phd/YefM family antitoxin [Gloeomargarita lithophora]|uniref:type II toxin-antitoxin system Phd/YefM family antitoxin n=1 Tax=Gloeomargarita lithophora TaxID=1188228 RepID=UPI003F72A529